VITARGLTLIFDSTRDITPSTSLADARLETTIISRSDAVGEQMAQVCQKAELDCFDADPRWHLAQRIVASQAFVRSRFLSRFLLYIVAETLADRTSEISEHQIGVLVFDRRPNYRSAEDNIVRTYARQLRRRLTEYFAGEGAAEPLHIDIPLGGYVPVFVPGTTESKDPSLSSQITLPSSSPALEPSAARASHSLDRRRHRSALIIASLAVYTFLLVWLVVTIESRFHAKSVAALPVDSTTPLWTALFGGPVNCYVVPADAGFNLLEDLSHHPLTLAQYLNGNFLSAPLPHMDEHSADDLHGQRFTSFVDLQTVTALAHLPEFNSQRVILRFPRDLQLDDLKSSNAIILGSMSSNPWAAIAESSANFRIVNDATMKDATILNLKPQPGEASSYASQWNRPAHETYAVIAFLPNLTGNGHFLLVQGLDVAGTQAAAEMLFHPSAMLSVLQRATRRDGSLRSFEILLRSGSIESSATNAQIIGIRIY
jgi:hypothetical protein